MKSTDEGFLVLKEKKRFADGIKDLYDNEAFMALINGMLRKRNLLIDASDSFEMTAVDAEKNRLMRAAIKTFLSSIVFSVEEGDRATDRINHILEFEKEDRSKKFERKGK